MRLEADQWLGQLFGYPVFRASAPAARPDLGTLRQLAGAGRAFCYAKVPVTEVAQVGWLTELGFKVVDVNLTLTRPPAPQPHPLLPVRPALAGEGEALLAIAGSCFVFSRFHLDPQIVPGLADEIKRAWVTSYLERRRGDLLLVAELEGRAAGFLAGLAATVGGRPAWVIDLMGVAPAAQRHGVGRSLVEHFVGLAEGRCEVVAVGTQAANTPSLGLYTGCGFRTASAAYVLHGHYQEGVIR